MVDRLTVYNLWDLSPPVVPPRSRLYSLEPIGIGTAFVESLTGYIARLAEAHAVSVGDLVGRELSRRMAKGPLVIPRRKRPHRTSAHRFYVMSNTLNGVVESSRKWIDTLERATLRQGLSALTLSPLEGVVDDRRLLRPVRAWCPNCYEERRRANSTVYDSLLWAVKVVTVCPRHQEPLEDTCPHCGRWQHPLAAYSRPGYCSRCRRWLGLHKGANGADGESRQGQADYQLWVANAVGELLAAAPRLQPRLLKDTVRHNLNSYIVRLAEGNRRAFARFVKSPPKQMHDWLTGQLIPSLDTFVRVCYHLEISLITVVTSGGAEAGVDRELSKSALVRLNGGVARRRHPDRVRRALEEALHEESAPSLSEIADRYGYKRVGSLYRVDRDLSKRIMANHCTAKRPNWWKRRGTERICDKATMKQSLESSLAQDQPISVHQLGKSHRYTSGATLYHKFPDLCRAISAKVAARNKTRLNAVERALRAALKEDPPPTLGEVSGRAGSMSPASLRRLFPVLCAALQAQRKQYGLRRTAELRKAAQALLSEDPPPSVQNACQRLGVSDASFYDKFPDLAHAIATRHLRHRAEAAQKRREVLRGEVRHAVLTLRDQGKYPSHRRVRGLLNENLRVRWDQLAECLREARQA